jgi:transaldolase
MIPDFVRAYDESVVSIEEFDTYGASVRTLRGFISGYNELMAIGRDFMLPNPDVRNT